MLMLMLACEPDPVLPRDSEPVDSEPPQAGTQVGDLAPELSVQDGEGNTYTLGEGQTVVMFTTMWDPTWQDVVRDVDALHVERAGGVEAWDVLVEDIAGELPEADDAAIWKESLGLSLPVLLGTEAVHADWFEPEFVSFVVVVDEGIITYRASTSSYSRAALLAVVDAN
jgi:hypothetical protein